MFSTLIVRISLMFLILALNATAQEFPSDNTDADMTKLAEAFLQQTNTPGLSIAIRQNQRTLYAKGFGYANLEENIKMDTTTLLRTASVAKVMTATALGILASEGKLDFDAPVKKYIPYVSETYANLTTRQLAGHTAGMVHRPKGEKHMKKQYNSIDETVGLIKAPLLFEADTDYAYSTHAFNLLAAVIEGASGKSYMEYMKELVFNPLKMNNTYAEDITKLTEKDAELYYLKNDKLRKEKATNGSYKLPGAGFRTTPSDLIKMMDAYSNGLISQSVKEDMFKSHRLTNGTKTHVGIAWRSGVDPFDNPVIEHAGSWRGARTVLVYYPNEDLSISLMINASCPVLIEETAHLFAQTFRNSNGKVDCPVLEKKPIVLTLNSKEKKETYTGSFFLNSNMGILKTTSKGFLKSNPIFHLGSQNDYAIATAYGLLYLKLKSTKSIEGQIYTYYNRSDTNPIKDTPFAYFRN